MLEDFATQVCQPFINLTSSIAGAMCLTQAAVANLANLSITEQHTCPQGLMGCQQHAAAALNDVNMCVCREVTGRMCSSIKQTMSIMCLAQFCWTWSHGKQVGTKGCQAAAAAAEAVVVFVGAYPSQRTLQYTQQQLQDVRAVLRQCQACDVC
jgi:hypothetical protein